ESNRQFSQIIQRIEQGMGRGIRSNDDYCVVFLIGKNLTRQLYSKNAISKLSQGTQAQLKLSGQVSEQMKGKMIGELTDNIKYCLNQNEEWVIKSKGVLANLKYSEKNELDNITIALRKSYDFALNNDFSKATEVLKILVNDVHDENERGYLKQIFAEYINLTDKVEAQKIQKSAINDNRYILKPIEGIEYHKITGVVLEQATSCSNYLSENYKEPNKLIIEVEDVLDKLQFKENSSEIFEEELKNIAKYLGFTSQNPEKECNKGPDVLWAIGELNFLVIECKNEAITETINKSDCNQLNGSCEWFKNQYDNTCSYVPIMVYPSRLFEYAASPNSEIKIITKDKLHEFCNSVHDFIKSVANNNDLGNKEIIRQKLIEYKLRGNDLVNNYTEKYKVKK
ncbi:MAG: hypothetical protein KAG43_04855, partial [Candidatus Marithrix sp.]|nr:hypothetical protein [Candidatus Marithrix sp.]